jgi:hypothetical protein
MVTNEIPQIGMGATIAIGTDAYPATIVAIKGKKVLVQMDEYRRTDKNGISEDQKYEYYPNPNAPTKTFTLRKNGRFVIEGDSMNSSVRMYIGSRRAYQDPSF